VINTGNSNVATFLEVSLVKTPRLSSRTRNSSTDENLDPEGTGSHYVGERTMTNAFEACTAEAFETIYDHFCHDVRVKTKVLDLFYFYLWIF